MRIAIIGFYPPPIGGISTHIARLKEHLDLAKVDYTLYDVSGEHAKVKDEQRVVVCKSFLRLAIKLFISKRCVIHFHNFSRRHIPLYAFLALRHRTVLSFHNERFLADIQGSKVRFMSKLYVLLLNLVHFFITDSPRTAELAKKVVRNAKKIYMVPEFIPPASIPEIDADDKIMQMRGKHRYLIASTAYRISFHQGQDLYGIDLLIEMLRRLVHDGIDAAICFTLPNIGDEKYYQALTAHIDEYGLKDRFYFITTPLREASSLYKICNVYVRATNTDGNSLSVLEAMAVRTPVLASDCVPRPPGVRLFKTRDINDLYENIKTLLNKNEAEKAMLEKHKIVNNVAKFLALYRYFSS
nr:glycosyltransferase family 4 protein [Candidatus Sigynarchaeota archaeon]